MKSEKKVGLPPHGCRNITLLICFVDSEALLFMCIMILLISMHFHGPLLF